MTAMEMQTDTHAGILSQTLTSSPCIKQVLAARVRTPYHNDVVMVGYSSIHLREFMATGDLSNVIAHLELGTQILSAKVISAEAHVTSVADPELESGRDEIQFFVKGEPCEATQPPQIVVLSTALSDLVFVYARILSNGSTQFVHARRHIMGGRHWPRRYGKQLAIDSESRALAIASTKGSFGLMALKDVEDIKRSIDQWDPREPSKVLPILEIFVQVDGVILRMDFLKSPSTEPRRVVLLLIVANRGQSRLLLYRWDSWQAITTTKPLKCSGYVLPAEDAFPHLLIPSCKLFSFAIVTGHQLVFYDDITSKKKSKRIFNIPTPDDQKDKLWVQWARAVRHEEHRKQKEDIFLVREDGLLKTTIVTHNSVQRAHITFEPGHLHIRVDTAVCALSAPPTKGGDVLIACGDTTQGGVFHLRAREPPINVQSLPNWSPVTDVIQLPNHNNHRALGDLPQVLATTGIHDKRAFLSELRYGIEAQIIDATRIEDAATVDRLWVLHRSSLGQQLLLTSHHEHSNVLCYEMAIEALTSIESKSCPQLGFEAATLTACNIDHDSILQITTNRVHFLGLSDQPHLTSDSLSGDFVCADAHANTGAFIMASRIGNELLLAGGVVTVGSDRRINVAAYPRFEPVDYLPISLAITNIGGHTMLITGSQDGHLYLYHADLESGIEMRQKWSLEDFDQDLGDPKVSSIVALSLPDAANCLVLCGLKSGQLILFELKLQSSESSSTATLLLDRSQSIGVTAIAISREAGFLSDDEKSAYVTCGSSIFQVRLYRNRCGLDYTLDSLLATPTHQDQDIHSRAQFNAVARIEQTHPDEEGSLCGLLAAFTNDALVLLRLGQSALVPRKITEIKPTRHIVHSRHLQKCIVSVAAKKSFSLVDVKQKVESRPSLQMLDPVLHKPVEGGALEGPRIYFGEADERVRALLPFTPTNGTSHYEMVVIGSDRNGDGRLSYITAKRLSSSKPGVSATTFITYPGRSVSALCEYGLSSLLVCVGRELKLVHLDLSTKPSRWEQLAGIELPSRAIEIKTKGSVIYLATSLHSYMLIREQDRKFQVIGSDSWAGKARNIVPYGHSSTLVNLVSGNGSRILNFADRPIQGMKPSFEATVPESIDKIINLKLSTGGEVRERFLGTTIDGAVYLFTTLREQEMKLLAFLEQLYQPHRDQGAKNASLLARRIAHQYANRLESAGISTPSLESAHAQGDALKALLAPGPYNIHFLLRKRVKVEGEVFIKEEDELQGLREVAMPVVGQSDDVVESVILWLRKLLNVPTF